MEYRSLRYNSSLEILNKDYVNTSGKFLLLIYSLEEFSQRICQDPW